MTPSNWTRNRLLLALPSRHLNRIMPELERIECQRGQILLDADSSLDHVFFPDSGVISMMAVYADGKIIEMATIGSGRLYGYSRRLRGQEFLRSASRANTGRRREDVALGVQAGNEVGATLPQPRVFLRAGLPRAGHGVSSMQRSAQSQPAACALAADDA